jgi:hypothetical protein
VDREYLKQLIQIQLNKKKKAQAKSDKEAEVKRLKAEKDAEKNKIETRAKEFKRYEYLMGIDDISRAVKKIEQGDSSVYNNMRGIDQFRVDEAMSLIDKYSKKSTTPSTTTTGGGTTGSSTTGGGPSIVDKKSKINQPVLDPPSKKQIILFKRKLGDGFQGNIPTNQIKSKVEEWWEVAQKGKLVEIIFVPPTDPNYRKKAIYSGFGDPLNINNWEIQ